jgi:hypothetical protein
VKALHKLSVLPAAVPVATSKILTNPIISDEMLNDDDLINKSYNELVVSHSKKNLIPAAE